MGTKEQLGVAKVPCGSCPYRRDVPSGLWAREEYDKLAMYDGSIAEQVLKRATGVFQCHQRDGNLCAGWLACHGPDNLAALRRTRLPIDPAVFDYQTHVPVFPSGAAARRHGLARIARPGKRAIAMVAGLVKKLGDRLNHR